MKFLFIPLFPFDSSKRQSKYIQELAQRMDEYGEGTLTQLQKLPNGFLPLRQLTLYKMFSSR